MKLKLQYLKRGSNLNQLKSFLRFMRGRRFTSELKEAFETRSVAMELMVEATGVIQRNIYDAVPEGKYKRTNRGLTSMKAKKGNSRVNPNITLYLSVERAPAKSGKSKGRFNYLAFFERPVEFKSFLLAANNLQKLDKTAPHRPFFKEMTQVASEKSTQITQNLSNKIIHRRKPRSRQQ